MIQMNRKMAVTGFLALCAFVLAAIPASAQPITFSVTSLAETARSEGQAETAGTVTLSYSGTAPATIVAGSSITVSYAGATVTSPGVVSGRITSIYCNVASSSSATSASGNNSATGTTGDCGETAPVSPPQMVYTASGSNVIIQFNNNVTINVGDYLNVQQVRLNIAQVTGAQPVTTNQTLNATLSGNSPTSNPITFTNSTAAVATLSSSIAVTKVTAAAEATCAVASSAFSVKVAKLYPAAITSQTDEASFTPGNLGPPVVTSPVTNGSIVNIVISNVPAGLAVTYTGFSSSDGILTFVASSGNTNPVTSTGITNSYTFGFVPTLTSSSAIETATFSFTLGATGTTVTSLSAQGLTSPQSVTAQAYLSPLGSTAIPRFTQLLYPAAPLVVGSVSDCVTNLLFPFHQATNGFDTSYAIANTSSNASAFGGGATPSGTGTTCKLVLWTTDFAGNAVSTVAITTPPINTGGTFAFSSASGYVAGYGTGSSNFPPGATTLFNNAAGYVIGVCSFLDAHAYALVTNGNNSVVPLGQEYSVGYLGLIIQNPTTGRVPSIQAPVETLAH